MSHGFKGVKPILSRLRSSMFSMNECGRSWHWAALVGFACGFFLVGIDRLPVPTVDGAVRASMARNIVRSGELWPITYEGRVFADHPPLFLWLTAIGYKIFGMGDFAANLVPRLFAVLTVVITFVIGLQTGLGRGAALAAALILCLTRDFVLSSVRGYIEPVLTFFSYAAIALSLAFTRGKRHASAALAGVAVWFAAYSKGPVALWPLLFCGLILRQKRALLLYAAAFSACTAIWAAWVESSGHWHHWADYLSKQVLGSALEGRGGAQQLEPLYFAKILARYYWPWLPLFVVAFYRTAQAKKPRHEHGAALFALGFIGAFSAMKWKFWYYIAPAYPAMALLIAMAFKDRAEAWLGSALAARRLALTALAWAAFASIVPIKLHRERVPEVMTFKETIRNSPVHGPVWFLNAPSDHNMVGTSGNWYFDRDVVKVENEGEWYARLRSPAWIITGADFYSNCKTEWCSKSRLIQTSNRSALLYFQQ